MFWPREMELQVSLGWILYVVPAQEVLVAVGIAEEEADGVLRKRLFS
jgi:hypothetical protein